MKDIFKYINNALELFTLKETNLLLKVLIFISILKVFWTDGMSKESLVILENNVFTNSLIGITIQDSSKREML